jgi:hypothetical protein
MAVSLPACDGIIYDDLDPCPHGVRLRFVYDHNMEFVNSFYKQADCLSLYVFDAEGNFVTKQVETTENLKKPDYAMQLDLERGNYRFLAYAGLECPEHSFSVVYELQAGRTPNEDTAMQVAMDEGKWGTSLHDLFYGSLNTTVEGDYYVDDTLYMVKNTNNIRVMLQQVEASRPLDDRNFTFTITDDNTLMDHENNLIPNGTVNYTPWAKGTLAAGTTETGEQEAKVAYAEFSTGRLVTRTHQTPRLVVMNKETGNKVIDIPLINYLLLLKSERYATMGAQEFLDRESDWSLIFFLNEEGNWLRTHIVVNDWIVRLNDMEL